MALIKRNTSSYDPVARYFKRPELDFIKTLLLFFDGIAISGTRIEQEVDASPELIAPLHELGLIQTIDEYALLKSNFSHLSEEEAHALPRVDHNLYKSTHATGQSHDEHDDYYDALGADLDALEPGTAKEWVTRELRDEISATIEELVLTARLRRSATHLLKIQLEPAYEKRDDAQEALLQDVVKVVQQGYSGTIVSLDLKAVVLRLDSVPLDEVLDFKKRHGDELRHYLRQIRQYLVIMGTEPRDGREQMLVDRREELEDIQDRLMRASRMGFKLRQQIPFFLGITGAIVSGLAGGPAGLAAGSLGSIGSWTKTDSPPYVSSYQYLFSAQQYWMTR